MKIELQSTDRIVQIEFAGASVPARVWVGKTGRGIECHAFITRIAVARNLDAAEFEAELIETHLPLAASLERGIPMRLVIG